MTRHGPYRSIVAPDAWYKKQLDDGIRFAVRALHANGVETCQSCEGGEGHSYPVPTVDVPDEPNGARGFHALAVLRVYGLPVDSVARVWNVHYANGLPYESLWRVTFRDKVELLKRADERTGLVHYYRFENADGDGK